MKLNNLIHRVKSHPGIADSEVGKLADDAFAFAVSQVIFPCLNELGEGTGLIIDKRNYVMSDPLTVTTTLDADGKAEIGTLIAEKGILLERLRFGEIKHASSEFPLKPLSHSGEGNLPGNYDSFGFLKYWMVGTVLHTRSADSNATPLAGDLSFTVPRVSGLDDLSTQLEDDLTNCVIARLRTAPQQQAVSQ